MGSDTFAFSVDPSFQAIGYMRGLPSSDGYILYTTEYSSYWWLVQNWPAAINHDGAIATGDFYGWSVRHVSGISVRVKSPASDTPYITVGPNETKTITDHTPNGIHIGSRLGDEGLGTATIELLPP